MIVMMEIDDVIEDVDNDHMYKVTLWSYWIMHHSSYPRIRLDALYDDLTVHHLHRN